MKSRSLRRLFLFGGIIAGVAWWIVHGALQSFPDVPLGSYHGVITGLTNDRSRAYALFVERLSNPERVVIAVFEDGWTPEMVLLTEQPDKMKLSADHAYLPATISHGTNHYTLSGKASAEGFSGTYSGTDGSSGKWAIKPTSSALGKTTVSSSAAPDLTHWLTIKRQYLILNNRIDSLKQARRTFVDNRVHFEDLLKEQGTLKKRASEKRSELEKQLQDVMTLREDLGSQIDSLMSQLSLLGRISNRGKAVDLARKVAKREQKWYVANWGEQEAPELENAMARELNVDSGALSTQISHAEEVHRLQLEIEGEQKRIEELKIQREQPDSGSDNQNSAPGKKDKRGIWKLLFG